MKIKLILSLCTAVFITQPLSAADPQRNWLTQAAQYALSFLYPQQQAATTPQSDDNDLGPNQAELDTQLLQAVHDGNLIEVQVLLDAGADPNKANEHSETPLYTAAFKNNHEMIQLLLDAGADPNKANKYDQTPLYIAVYRHNNLKMVQALIQAKANPQVLTIYKETTLYHAVLHNNLEMIQLLLDAGADPNIPNFDNETPAQTAKKYGYTKIAELLEQAEKAYQQKKPMIKSARKT